MQIVRNWFRSHFNDPEVVVLTLLILGGVLLVAFLGGMLLPVLASVAIAYLLEGLVGIVVRRGGPRLPTVLVVYFAFLTLFLTFMLVLIPLLYSQLIQAVEELPNMVVRVYDQLKQLPERYTFINREQFDEVFFQVRGSIQQELTRATGSIGKQILAISVSSFKGLITLFVYIILMPILVFFMLKDKERILGWFERFLPAERKLATEVWRDVDRQIGNYVRGKVWEIIIVGAVTYATFKLFGLNYAVLLGLAVGLSVVVPYVGATVVTFPVAIVAYAQWGTASEFWWLMGTYALIQALDGNLLVPLIFSEVVHLHPIAIIAAVLVFGGLWGFWGVFFAIPLATLVHSVIKAWPRKVRTADVT